jgi:hypothetical protein
MKRCFDNYSRSGSCACTSFNVFTALAERVDYKLSLSPAGQTAQQIIKTLGDHLALSNLILKSERLLKRKGVTTSAALSINARQ